MHSVTYSATRTGNFSLPANRRMSIRIHSSLNKTPRSNFSERGANLVSGTAKQDYLPGRLGWHDNRLVAWGQHGLSPEAGHDNGTQSRHAQKEWH